RLRQSTKELGILFQRKCLSANRGLNLRPQHGTREVFGCVTGPEVVPERFALLPERELQKTDELRLIHAELLDSARWREAHNGGMHFRWRSKSLRRQRE